MAQQSNVRSSKSGPRKKLVQPVLPALPLLSKAKPSTKPKEEEKPHSNGTGLELPNSGVKLQSSTSTSEQQERPRATEHTVSPEDKKDAARAVDHESEPVDQGNGLPHNEPDLRFSAGEEHASTPDVTARPIIESRVDKEELHSATEDPVKLPAGNAAEAFAYQTSYTPERPAGPESQREIVSAVTHTDLAPEPVSGHVEKSDHYSSNPSISDTSVQQTPKHGIALPVSPRVLETSQQHTTINGYQHHQRLPSYVNGHTSSPNISGTANSTIMSPTVHMSIPTIYNHISAIQFSPEWFDCELCVYLPQSTKPAVYRNAHSLVLIRSERLKNFILPQRASSYSYYVINLSPARAIGSNAFDAALRFLYADTILSAERFFPPYTGLDKGGRIGALDYLMSYMTAGLELGLEPVTTRALDLIGRLLDWDIAEAAVKEAYTLRAASVPTVNLHAPPDALLAAKSLLQHVFNLIILRLDVPRFKLDAVSAPTDMISRLIQFEASRASINPALAKMVFGSMPASVDLSPTQQYESLSQAVSPDTVASVVMLNLDFEDLSALASGLKRVHGSDSIRIICDVVEEREARRLNILDNPSISNKQRLENSSTWHITGWREFFADDNLQRERIGLLPHSK